MSTQATVVTPAKIEKSEVARRRLAALTDELALKIFIAVATTVVLGRLGFDPTTALIGAAFSPILAELIQSAVERRGLKRRHLLPGTLLLFLVHGVERALAAARGLPRPPKPSRDEITIAKRLLLGTGAVASVVTIAGFTAAEALSGHSLIADRPLTFFGGGGSADVVPPDLTLPSNIVVESYGPRPVWFSVSAVDSRDGDVEPTCTHEPGARFPIGKTRVRCSVVDDAGNRKAGAFTVTLVPLNERERSIRMRFPERVEAEATGPQGAIADFVVSASDRGGDSLTPDCSPASASLFPIGRTIVTCTAREGAETATRRFPVVVLDTTPPRLTVPADIEAQTRDGGRVMDYGAASAIDLVDGTVTVSCNPGSGSRFAVGTTAVVCAARDAHGNEARGQFAVTLVSSDDTTPPELELPDDRREEATSEAGAVVSYKVDAGGDHDEDISVTCTPSSGVVFAIGRSRVECMAIDQAGNRDTGSFMVTVSDTRAPALTIPGDQAKEAASVDGVAVSYTASARDTVDGPIVPRCSPETGLVFSLGMTVVHCSVRDNAGNAATGDFAVTVRDTTGPVIEAHGTTAEARSASGAPVAYRVTARDAVDGLVSRVSCSPPSGSTFPLGNTTVTCRATDRRENLSVRSLTATVSDRTGPTVFPPRDVRAEARSRTGAQVRYGAARATDAVDGAVRASCSPLSGSTFRLGETIVTCSAVDRLGNTGRATFRVTVGDTTPPTLRIPNLTRYIDSGSGTEVSYPPAIDEVDGRIVPTCQPPSGSFFAARTLVTVRCFARDRSGNRSPWISFTVWVEYTPE